MNIGTYGLTADPYTFEIDDDLWIPALGTLVAKPSVVQVCLFALVIILLMIRSRRQSALVRL